MRQLTFEAGFSGHATCPPVTGPGPRRIGRRGHAHRGKRVVQPGLGRTDGDAQGRRHLWQRIPRR